MVYLAIFWLFYNRLLQILYNIPDKPQRQLNIKDIRLIH